MGGLRLASETGAVVAQPNTNVFVFGGERVDVSTREASVGGVLAKHEETGDSKKLTRVTRR